MPVRVASWLRPYLTQTKVAKKRPLTRILIGLRKEKGWTQKQLSEVVERHQSMVSRVESGSEPSLSYITAFAEALALKPTQVVDLMALAGKDPEVLIKEEKEIEAEIAEAHAWLKETCHFLHTQSGTGYWVTGFAVREEDCEVLVVYSRARSHGDQSFSWSMPLTEFKKRFEAATLASD